MKSSALTAFAVLLVVLVAGSVAGCSREESARRESSATESEIMVENTPPPSSASNGKNRLAGEKSPYLLQHADNPVDWYPWGADAFDEALRLDKPIFLSIGYSTCHWCHVMEHESFEDEQVAALMNEAFVCIKVDREERPDVDNIYMTVCQMMTGRGGWPLTIIMTPNREPFFAGTYIPRQGMLDFIPRIRELWDNDRQKITTESNRVLEALQQAMTTEWGDALGIAELDVAFSQFAARYDVTYGGFGTSPKFPTPHNLMFLLRYWKRTGDELALEMVENTLERMRRGGMYDHIGFGFHRYSTDQRWFLPHFEKMLYDQALLVMVYTEAYQATGKDSYRRTAEEIITYVLRDMTDAQGGFFSAEDADSEGEEGKFYLWSEAELRRILGDAADLAVEVFGATPAGNYAEEASGGSKGVNILYHQRPLADVADARSMDEADLRTRLEDVRRKLFDVREARVHPYKDDKIVADWNGLMIAALAKAARVFGNDEYARYARAAAEFVMDTMASEDGGLRHRYREGESSFTGMIDDYVFVSWGLLELYETTFDIRYLRRAIAYSRYAIDNFWDDESGGFYFTSKDGEKLIVRQKEIYDGAVPSANSVAMMNLIRIGRITADSSWEERARDIGRAFQTRVTPSPSAHAQMMSAVDFAVGPSFEIVIAGKSGAQDTNRMVRALETLFVPRKVVVFRPEGKADDIVTLAPYTKTQVSMNGRATAYVCRNYACELPTSDIDRMLELLSSP